MRRNGRVGVVAAVAGLMLAGAMAPLPAAAASVTQYGTVTFVPDGDTIDVDIEGDGTRTPRRIRLVGIQAMEVHTYKVDLAQATGECHALAATARLRQLLGGKRVTGGTTLTSGKRVRLTARDSRSSSRDRPQRYVAVRTDGVWRDVGYVLVKEGHAIPQPHSVEYTLNRTYRVLAREAAYAHRGIWNRDSCGVRPAATAKLAVAVNWDAPGDDSVNRNGEYVIVTNKGTSRVSLAGWWVRDSALRRYTLPSGTSLAPGHAVFVHAGRGTTSRAGALHLYWGQASPVFENVTGSPSYKGDGAYLFDPRGNLRAWKQYGRV